MTIIIIHFTLKKVNFLSLLVPLFFFFFFFFPNIVGVCARVVRKKGRKGVGLIWQTYLRPTRSVSNCEKSVNTALTAVLMVVMVNAFTPFRPDMKTAP
jgi:hypothetical protein